MSLLGSIGQSFGLTGSNAGGDAAQLQALFNAQAINELKRQFDVTQENLAPFQQVGTTAAPQFSEATTIQGLDRRIGEILDTDSFGSLLDARRREVENRDAATGQLRSGLGTQNAANLPTQLAFGIEGDLTSRLFDALRTGLGAATTTGQLGAQTSGSIASLLQDSGRAGVGGIITDAQSESQRAENFFDFLQSIGKAGFGFADGGFSGGLKGLSGIGL